MWCCRESTTDLTVDRTSPTPAPWARPLKPSGWVFRPSPFPLDAIQLHLLPLLRELTENRAELGAVWNVNFPAVKEEKPLRGILRDRVVCPVSMYQERYVPVRNEDGKVWLECRGIPTPDSMIPAGTDAAAVRSGYLSIGQVGCLFDVWEEKA